MTRWLTTFILVVFLSAVNGCMTQQDLAADREYLEYVLRTQ